MAKDHTTIRLLNTLLNVSKVIRWWGPSDYQTITMEGVSEDRYESIIQEALPIVKEWVRFIDTECDAFHFSGASGPNGKALVSSLWEAHLLPETLIDEIRILGGEWLHSHLLATRSIVAPLIPEIVSKYKLRFGVIRRLHHRLDFEGKRRPIAIFDYWSQAALKGVHDSVFRLLRKLPSDMTFDQGRFARGDLTGPYFCYDLHAATDRFPVSFQERVIAQLTDVDRARAWRAILTNYQFLTPEGQLVKYQVGQPMGGFSSWAVFSLCHHLVVQVAARRCGLHKFWDYWLLGDDIVIRNKDVASQYLGLLHDLGVEVSLDKSMVSEDTFEFAKRLFHNGEEVSGLSINALELAKGRFVDLWAYFKSAEDKGWRLPETARYGHIKELITLMGKPRSYASRSAFKMRVLDTLYTVIRTHPEGGDLTRPLLADMGLDMGCNRERYSLEFLLECTAALKVQGIQESLMAVTKEVNVFIQELATLAAGQVDLTSENIQSLPPVGAFLAKGEVLQRDAMTVEDLARSQDWIGFLRSGVELVPDPRRTITRMTSADRVRASQSISSRLISLVREESRLRERELSG